MYDILSHLFYTWYACYMIYVNTLCNILYISYLMSYVLDVMQYILYVCIYLYTYTCAIYDVLDVLYATLCLTHLYMYIYIYIIWCNICYGLYFIHRCVSYALCYKQVLFYKQVCQMLYIMHDVCYCLRSMLRVYIYIYIHVCVKMI